MVYVHKFCRLPILLDVFVYLFTLRPAGLRQGAAASPLSEPLLLTCSSIWTLITETQLDLFNLLIYRIILSPSYMFVI